MIRFVPLAPELLAWAVVLSCDEDTRRLHQEVPALQRALLDHSEYAEAMFDANELIGTGGLIQHWHGRAEAWLIMRPDATKRQRAAALRRCQATIGHAQRNGGYRRIEMYVPADAPWCGAFGALMGFQSEGLLRRWGYHGDDHRLFSRIVEAR